MSSLGSPNPFFIAGKKAYEIERSLRVNDNDSAYLSRTPSSAGNRRTFTISVWTKRANLTGALFGSYISDSDRATLRFSSDYLEFQSSGGASVKTNAVFRDSSAWYHIVCAIDTTQGTQSNRGKLYVNGVQQELSSNSFSQDVETSVNNNSLHVLGTRWASDSANMLYDGYLAEVNLIDGLALDPSYFGATDAITGQWNPKKYGGGYGTNGFYLNFSDNSGTTATTLGKDSSGNGNNFTPNNFSVAAGTGNDSLTDTPTNNFCTLNNLDKSNSADLRDGALTLYTDSNDQAATGTFAVKSGKWYWEVDKNDTEPEIGIAHHNMPLSAKSTSLPSDGQIAFIVSGADSNTNFLRVNGSTTTGTGMSAQTGTGSIGIALDMDNKKIWWSDLSGNYFNSGNPATGANAQVDFSSTGEYPNGVVTPFVSIYQGSAKTTSINFGQRPFTHTQPTGFETLCSANLPDPTILLPNKHFDTLLYSGTGSSNSITGLNFAPNWTWIKSRSLSSTHKLMDSVRGDGLTLASNNTNAEASDSSIFSSLDSSGFTVTGTANSTNASSATYVGWNWNAGDTDGKTYTVTVVDDSGNKYRFDGFGTSAVTLDLAEGGTYIFNYPSAHPLKFSTTADGTHGGGSEYTTGVTHNSSTQVTIVVAASAPTLYYYCGSHSGMGGQVNTNSTLGSSNFDGSIQSTAKVNASAGFSIVTHAGTGQPRTIGHGLGVAPKVIIMKGRNVTDQWTVGHNESATSNPWQNGIALNSTTGLDNNSAFFYDAAPTSTVFTRGNWDSGYNMVNYCFSEVAGYSKFGSYTGNGSTNGTFVFTGFRPAWVMTKNTDTGSTWWFIYDVKRETYNPMRNIFGANSSDAEYYDNAYKIDILSNGFKARGTQPEINKSGDTIIYLAFAESPFKNARAR
jgi:hypothetical protein